MTKHNKRTQGIGRRDMLRNLAVVGGGAAALGVGGLSTLGRLASGQTAEDRFYVIAYFSGGWDTLLHIDPRDPSVFTEEQVGDTRIQPRYDLQAEARFQEAPRFAPGRDDLLLGPAARPLEAIADRVAVVRGMSMDTLTHEVGRRRFITGKPPSGLNARGSAQSAWLASQFGGSRLIPNLSVRVESFNPDLATEVSALRVGSPTDLVAILRRSDPALDEDVDTAVTAFQADQASCARALSSPTYRAAESSRLRMRAVLDADIQALFDFRADTPEMEALRGRYGFTTSQLTGSGAQAAIAAQALINGVSRVVSIQAAGGLDTHFDDWEDDHAPSLYDGFDALTRLAQHLEETPFGDTGESMLDRTVIVGFSEFMRTPMLNQRGGRDHWLTNSAVLIGGNIAPVVVGASSNTGMSPQPIDRMTGQVAEAGEIVYPEHIWRTLLHDAGLEEDRADLRVEHIPALLRG